MPSVMPPRGLRFAGSDAVRKTPWFAVLSYAVFCTYLFPLGVIEVMPQIKPLYTAVWAVSVLAMVAYIASRARSIRFRVTWQGASIVSFFLLNILITFVDLRGFGEGLRTLFGWPILFAWLVLAYRENRNIVLVALANTLIVLFLLQDACFAVGAFGEFLHLGFLGHVQVVGQEGLVAFLVVVLGLHEKALGRMRAISLLFFACVALVVADADSSKVVLVLAAVALACSRSDRFVNLFGRHAIFLMVVIMVLSVTVVWLSVIRSNLFGLSWDFSARGFIWREALDLFLESPLLGFGVQGVKMDLFWGASMNYAHNQLIQMLLDGGLLLCGSFVAMLVACASLVKRIPDRDIRYAFTAVLGIYLILMTFDSATYYCFLYIVLAPIDYYSRLRGRKEEYGSR